MGGTFTSIGGQPRNRIARLDGSTGTVDSFNPNANASIVAIVVQSDGKILVGGGFNTIGGQARTALARLDATTGLADSFNPNANTAPVWAIALQADGKILAGGNFTSMGGQARSHIARLDATTGAVDSFNPNANDGIDFSTVNTIAVQPDGKILVGGVFTSVGGQSAQSHRATRSHDGPGGLIQPQPQRKRYLTGLRNRGAGGRQGCNGRLFLDAFAARGIGDT